MSISTQRQEAIAKTMEHVRTIECSLGVTRESLEKIKVALIELASRKELFPASDFPSPEPGSVQDRGPTKNILYRLWLDDDKRYSLVISSENPGRATPPHDHTTWAILTTIEGEDTNRIYKRIDDGSQPGKAKIKQVAESVVRPGEAVCLMPDEIHSSNNLSGRPSLSLHLYGRALETLTHRVSFNEKDGTCSPFVANPVR